MKNMKKALCIVLCLLAAFSCFALTCAAEDEPVACEHEYRVTTVAPTCAEQGYQLHVCSKCGDYFKDNYTNPLGHIYGEWTNVRTATCTVEGLQERECVRCHGKETRTISVIPHVDEDENGKCDVCGAKVEVKKIFSPFEWLKSFIQFLREWFNSIFA